MSQEIELKLKEVVAQLDKSLANHNFLLGAKAALEQLLNEKPVEPSVSVNPE